MEDEDDNACVGENGEIYNLEDMFKTVRELLGNNLPEQEIKIFMRSELFREVFPHWHEAFNSMEHRVLEKLRAKTLKSLAMKQEKIDKGEEAMSSKQAATVDKYDVVVVSSDADEREEAKPHRKLSSSDRDNSSESENDERRHRKKVKQKKHRHHHRKKTRAVSSGSSSSGRSSREVKIIKKEPEDIKVKVKKEKEDPDPGSGPSKIHPFYLQDTSAITQPKGKIINGNQSDDDSEHERRKKKKSREREESKHKKKSHHHHHKSAPHHSKQPPPPPPRPEQKGRSYYNPSSAKAIESGKVWKPFEDSEFSKNEKLFGLGGLSILCVDLAKLDTVFYNPAKGHSSKSAASIPLKTNMIIPERKADEIESIEARKRRAFQPELRKMYKRNVKNRHHSKKESSGNKSTKDQRQKGLEQLREKAEQKSKMTRKLPWENKEFFDKKKPTRPPTAEKKEGSNQKPNKPGALPKIPKVNAPGTSMQAILQQISSANDEAATKPKIELKIPKLSAMPYAYKKQPAQKSVTGGLVSAEVDKLLRSNTTVQCPTMTTSASDLAEYTIRKIGWWLLKEEQDPPDEVLYHPELHDNEIYEDWYDPDDHIDDDDISIGCVSDPEGTDEPVLPVGGKPEKPDADKLDEYAGLATLEARIPNVKADMKPGKTFEWIRFIKPRLGSNYEKSNFEAKCYLCNGEVVKGRRQLGAHFRSDHHKDAFRNYSLKLAKYEELSVKVPVRKVFVAKLVQYTTEDYAVVPATSDIPKDSLSKSLSPNPEAENDILVPDSPRGIIDSNHGSPAPAAEMVRLQDVDEELSLPSLAMYDLEQDSQQLRAKICLRTNGLWTDEMEKRWLVMQEKETRMTDQYNEIRERYINAPDTHPLHNNEWAIFWDRRCTEVEAQGKNPDEMDFKGEWVPFWLKRVQEIMKADIEAKMLQMKQELGLDATTLTERCQRHGFSCDSEAIGGKRPHSSTPVEKTNQPLSAQPIQVLDTSAARPPDGQRVIQLMHQFASTDMSVPPPPPPPRPQGVAQLMHQLGSTDLSIPPPPPPPRPQGVIQLMNQFASTDMSVPPPPPPPQSRPPESYNSHFNKNTKDQKYLSDNHRENRKGRGRGRFGRDRSRSPSGRGGSRHDRKREYRRSPPPKQFGNNRRPSNEGKYSNQNPPTKVSSPESDWETGPQQKMAKSSNLASQSSGNYNSSRGHPEHRRPSHDDNRDNSIDSANTSESNREKEPPQKLTKSPVYPNNIAVSQNSGNQISVPPKHRRTSYEGNHRKASGTGNKISSPESDWEKEYVQNLENPSTFPTVTVANSHQKYSENYNSGQKFPPALNNNRKHDRNRQPQHHKVKTSPESDWETESAQKSAKAAVYPPAVAVPETAARGLNQYRPPGPFIRSTAKSQIPSVSSRKETTSTVSHNPDLNLLLAELNDAITLEPLAEPILPASKTSSYAPGISTLEPILSDDDDAKDVPYSPVSVLSLDPGNDPFRGVSPINSIELSVEMTPVEEEGGVDVPRLQKAPKCDKRNKNIAIVNPSSPEDGEIDSPPSSVCLDENNVSSFIEPFNKTSKKEGKSSFYAAAAAAEMDKNSLGYQLYLNQSRNATDGLSNHRSSSKETSGSTNPSSKDRSKDKADAPLHNPWL